LIHCCRIYRSLAGTQSFRFFLLCRDLPDAQLGRLRASSSLVCGERIHGEPVQVVTGATALGPASVVDPDLSCHRESPGSKPGAGGWVRSIVLLPLGFNR
jgi:hypothetical protein